MKWLRAVAIAFILAATVGGFFFATFFVVSGRNGPVYAGVVVGSLALLASLVVFVALRRVAIAARREATRPTPEPVGPEEVRVVPKGPVNACLRCGSMEVIPAPLGADAFFSQWWCRRCDWRGQPLLFDTGAEYAEFVSELRESRR